MTRRISRRGLNCHLDIFSGFWMMLLKDLAKLVPKTHLVTEAKWRNLGVQQSLGMIFIYALYWSIIHSQKSLVRIQSSLYSIEREHFETILRANFGTCFALIQNLIDLLLTLNSQKSLIIVLNCIHRWLCFKSLAFHLLEINFFLRIYKFVKMIN